MSLSPHHAPPRPRARSHRFRAASTPLLAVALMAGTAGAAAPPAAAASPSAPPVAVPPAPGDTGRQRYATLDRLARDLVEAGAPGVVVRVADGRGRPVEIVRQAPWAARDRRLAATDEFRMGSNTKTLMAALVLLLEAEGALSLSDPVERWLPGEVPGGASITLRMLLDHTSGLYDYTRDPALIPSILGKDDRRWTSRDLLALGVRHAPLFPPGTRWSYSNTDYAAVGAVLERVTGASLAELVRDRIARPLGLEHTYFATDGRWRGRHAHGYEPDAAHMPDAVPEEFRDVAGARRGTHVDVSANDPGWGGAAGAVVSTARDWARFTSALLSGELLPAAQMTELRRTVPMDPERPQGPGAGPGIETGDTPCGTVWAHDGGMTGYSSLNAADRAGSRSAVVLVPTEFRFEFAADPELTAAHEALVTAAVCAMHGRPVPGAAPAQAGAAPAPETASVPGSAASSPAGAGQEG
ncbi:serine hydrolase domain-containing protein [Streptomyces lavendulocolor]|uniref:serine hydrolase domain-containing protein n=1 Tax=Streptomyces lavendulocolor TaxID=67316 RepID=UPI003C2DB345